MTVSFMMHVSVHWWKAWDECMSEERLFCYWHPTFSKISMLQQRGKD